MTLRRARNFGAAFARLEIVAIVVLVAVILILAWPTINNALVKRDLTRTMNNARELYLVAFRMATDGVAKADSTRAWPGDYPAASLAEYGNKLVQHDYLKPADLQRMLSTPGAECTATMSGPPATLMLSGKSALKLYKVRTADPSNAIFAASSNYVYNTPLNSSAIPFGDAGFVVVRKRGDAGIYKKSQATLAGFDNVEEFQERIGVLPGASNEVVTSGDGANALTNPP